MGELKQKAVKGVAWNTINTVSTLAVNFIVGIILARKLMPDDFGAIAMIQVFTSVLAIFTDGGGLTLALVRKENRTETDKSTVFVYNIVACYIIYGIIYCIAPLIAKFYAIPILCKLTRISSLSLLISPFAGIQRMHLTSAIDFKTQTSIGIAASLTSSILAITMAYCGYGVWSLAVPGVLHTIISTGLLIAIVRWKPNTGFSWSSFRELFGYSSKLLISSLIDKIYNNITPLIVGKFFSPTQLGIYNQAQKWPNLPSQTFTSVLQTVTFPLLSKLQDDKVRLTTTYVHILRLSAYICFPLIVGLATIAKPLTIILVTEKWIDSVILMQLICLSMMWYPIHAINLNLLTVTGRSDYFLKLEVIKKVLGLMVMFLALPFGLVAFCAAGIASSLVALFINTWYTKKIINYGFREQMKDLLPFLFNNLIMGFLCLLVQMPFESNILKLIIVIPVAIVYYILSSSIFQKEQYNEILEIASSKLPMLRPYIKTT